MAVKLEQAGQKQSFPLTSPPKPYALDSLEWIDREINFTDRKLGITHPFPDKIDLIAPISLESHCVPDVSAKSVHQKAQELDQDIRLHLKSFPAVDGIHLSKLWPPYDPQRAVVRLTEGSCHLAHIEIWRKKGSSFWSWFFKLSFNPRKLGPEGLDQLGEKFELAFGFLRLGVLLQTSELSRLDATVDVIGASPIDLIARIPSQGKNITYSSPAAIETILFHEAKQATSKSLKTVGPQRLKIYDRIARQKVIEQVPDFASERITRLEVTRRWKSHRPTLAKLLTVKNLFSKIEVAYANRDDLVTSRLWREVVERAILHGIDGFAIEAPIARRLQLTSIYKSIAPDILSAASWDGWETGVELTGLKTWVSAVCSDNPPSLPFKFE